MGFEGIGFECVTGSEGATRKHRSIVSGGNDRGAARLGVGFTVFHRRFVVLLFITERQSRGTMSRL
jgi:hypothetical protein